MITPLRLLTPEGAGGTYDTSELIGEKFPAVLYTGNTTLSQPGRPSGGAEPLERQVT